MVVTMCGGRYNGVLCLQGFFRRTVKERDMAKYECSRQSDCQITTATRNICKYCRYQKCLDVGMKPDGAYTEAVTSRFVVACTYIHTLLTAATSGQLPAMRRVSNV